MDNAEIIAGLLSSGDDDNDEVSQILAGLNLDTSPTNSATDLVLAGLGGVNLANLPDALKQQLVQKVLAKNAVAVRNSPPTRAREWPLPFDSVTPIAPGDIKPIAQQTQVVYKPTSFVVPSDIAGSFAIRDITIGQRSQWATPGAVPARMFQEDSTQSELNLDTAQVSMAIILQVENISQVPTRFIAGMKGIAVQ